MAQLFKNNATATLGANLTSISTSLTLSSGHGARFPTPSSPDYFLLTLIGRDVNGKETSWEVVRCTSKSGDVLTVQRAYDGTSAVAWPSGTEVEARVTASTFDNLKALIIEAGITGYSTTSTPSTTEKGYLISPASTFTLPADSVVGIGWYCTVKNASGSDVAFGTTGGDTIDGVTSFTMYPGESRLVVCTGANAFTSVVLTPFFKKFTSSGTFNKPPGYSEFEGLLWAGGASGCKGAASSHRPGGPGGACAPFRFPAASLSASETVTIGAGGSAVTAASANGNAGGTSTFKTVSAYGGTAPQVTQSTAQLGGSAYISGVTYAQSPVCGAGSANADVGMYAGAQSGVANVAGGINYQNTVFGGASGGSISATGNTINTPGSSQFGGAGGAAFRASSGTNGSAPGGGGGATETGAQSGAGGNGEMRIGGIV